MKRPIAIGLSPNAEKKDVLLAIRLLFSPWEYVETQSIRRLEQWFRQFFGVPYAITFVSARAALFVICKALGIGKGDEVIVQPFTCSVVIDAIQQSGATVVYADVTSSFVLDPNNVAEKMTKRTKAVLVQHTFGIPAPLEEIGALAKKKKLFVIEDVAHTIGGEYKGRKLGLFGDVSFFSFGRDKAFSCVFGGIVIAQKREFGARIRHLQRTLSQPSFLWVVQQLLHPILFSVVLLLYDTMGLGKVLLVLFQKMRIVSLPVVKEELLGYLHPQSIRKMPNQLAALALLQLERIDSFNKHRKEIASLYQKRLGNLPITYPNDHDVAFLRFPILVDNRDDVLLRLRKHRVYLGTWYAAVIDPKGTNLSRMNYRIGLCPKAEELASQVLNLPTYPTLPHNDAEKVIDLLTKYVGHKRD